MYVKTRPEEVSPSPGTHPTCRGCPLSLLCLSGVKTGNTYYCQTCEGFWIADRKTLVRCTLYWRRHRYYCLPACPNCEPYELEPGTVTIVEGVQ